MASLKARLGHAVSPNSLRAYLAEFISTFIFVFAAVGAVMSTQKMVHHAAPGSSSLVAVAVAHGFAMFVAVYISYDVSGGHANPAVSFGMVVGGHISIPMFIFYFISQMVGSVMACLLLKITTVSQRIPPHGIIPHEMTGFGASMLEGVMTFTLVYAAFAAAAEKRRGVSSGAMGPLAIGLIAGANVLAARPFTGGSMNPAYSFGSALMAPTFKNQAVYWVGPLIGAAIASILYDNVVSPKQPPDVEGSVDQVAVEIVD